MIPYGKQEITEDDIEAVVNVMRSDFITQGPVLPQFESAVATYCNAKHAVAVNSATSALHIACLALGLGPGDTLWTSPNTFVASANCALYCGANIDFVDIDERTYNLCTSSLAHKLEKAEREGKLPKIVIPVHFAGHSCEMHAIKKLSAKYGFSIIEDASHAIGGRYQNNPVGCCLYSDITIFSFHPVKIITSAEGGAATTNSQFLADKMSRLRTHGVTRDKSIMQNKSEGSWIYEQIELGYNYRMTDMLAALGLNQMKRLDDYVRKRNQLAKRYNEKLANIPLTVPHCKTDVYSAYHLYVICLETYDENLNRKQIFETLREAGIGVNIHYIPVHTQPFYRKLGFKQGDYPNAEKYYQKTITLPLFPGLKPEDQNYIISKLSTLIEQKDCKPQYA